MVTAGGLHGEQKMIIGGWVLLSLELLMLIDDLRRKVPALWPVTIGICMIVTALCLAINYRSRKGRG
jgi:hypothetical protein